MRVHGATPRQSIGARIALFPKKRQSAGNTWAAVGSESRWSISTSKSSRNRSSARASGRKGVRRSNMASLVPLQRKLMWLGLRSGSPELPAPKRRAPRAGDSLAYAAEGVLKTVVGRPAAAAASICSTSVIPRARMKRLQPSASDAMMKSGSIVSIPAKPAAMPARPSTNSPGWRKAVPPPAECPNIPHRLLPPGDANLTAPSTSCCVALTICSRVTPPA
mmetsp:Transcript_30272/g.92526  ORF Transcript_30272/g.92526 Transcript_30272/m.92526 type:complete len:220 (+) Transcript_30272:454-1113(+)|eukprot:scaffold273976_cov28-Tisochrysis_lutea.AAC.2